MNDGFNNLEVCGCGKQAVYDLGNGKFACNKRAVCPVPMNNDTVWVVKDPEGKKVAVNLGGEGSGNPISALNLLASQWGGLVEEGYTCKEYRLVDMDSVVMPKSVYEMLKASKG